MALHMVDPAAVREALSRECPGRNVGDIRLLGEGWDSIVYLAGDAIVLRFPKNATAARALATEIRLLPTLRDRLPLPIPQPSIVGKHPLNPAWLFMGYPRIDGIALSRERFYTLSTSVQNHVAHDLAEFLAALHTCDLTALRGCGVLARDLRAEFIDVFLRAETAIVPLLDRAERFAFKDWSGAILADSAMFAARSTLIHGDLSPDHIFYDSATQRISGIIDFGDCAIADPDYDLMYLLEDYGRPFVHALLAYYKYPDYEDLIRKLEAFRLFDAARYVLFGHVRLDSVMVRDGFSDLQQLLRLRSTRASVNS